VLVPVRCADSTRNANRYPYVESLFEDPVIQPYIHNCVVKLHDGSHNYHFMVFFKRHRRLRTNRTITGGVLRGDVVVMRIAARNDHSVVNMRERDTIVADWVTPKSVYSDCMDQL
jgi:hypothetical protein